MKSIVIKNLFYRYDEKKDYVLKDINLEVDKGESIVILGSSGVGKSTLLRCINRLINPEPKRGKILINGENILKMPKKKLYKTRRKIGMIFQNFAVLNTLPVIDSVLAGRLGYNNTLRSSLNIFSPNDYRIAMYNIKRVGLKKYTNKWTGYLSGGEKQRVGVARALSQKPEIMLADEPVSNLDPKLMVEIMDLIKSICKEDSLTLIANLHFIELAKRYADRVIGMKDGSIVFDDAPSKLTKSRIEDIFGKTKEQAFYNKKAEI